MTFTNNPKVSIIVPCYKVEQYLPTCIESVLSQSYIQWELILVDDGSPDRSSEICDEYASKDNRIRVIHKVNAGVAAARNSGVELATGDYATYLDADDFLHHDFLKNIVRIAEDRKADIVQCAYVRGDNNTFPTYKKKEVLKEYTNHSVFAADVTKTIVWGKLYRIYLLKDTLIPEGKYFEDEYVTWRWYYAANRIVVTSRPYYYYTFNLQSTMAHHNRRPDLSFIEAYEERINYFRLLGERDLEDYSHLHICKSLCLMYGNPNLSSQQKEKVLKTFNNSWTHIRYSRNIKLKYKLLFALFAHFPSCISIRKKVNISLTETNING